MTGPPSTDRIDTSVLIAGGGPVGITMAMDLARLGVESVVLEREHGLAANPRCNTTNARSMELLRRLGCADAVRAVGLPADHSTDIVYMTQLNGHEVIRFERSTPADVRAGCQHGVAANWPTPEPQHFVSQLFLEPVLRSHAVERFGVDFREGHEFVSFEQDDSGVTSTVRDLASGEEYQIRSRYLVGADGSSSIVRKAIGARLDGIPKLGEMCSTFFRSPHITELTRRTPGWMLRFIGGATLVAIDGDDRWLIHNGVPDDEDPATYDPEPAMFLAIGEPFEYEILGRARWTPRAMVATTFRDRRAFIAGDAAHIWVPMGGFGMNAGITDAISLSWRLAGALAGWADDRLLDTYEGERAPIGREVADQAVTWAINNRIHTAYTPERLTELDSSDAARVGLAGDLREVMLSEFECPGFQLGLVYADSAVICHDDATPPPTTSVVDYEETSWPGARLPHLWRADGSSIFDQLGTGFTLLRIGAHAPEGDAIVEAASAIGAPLVVLDISEPEAVVKYQGFGLVLVRPDQHIAWRSNEAPDAAAAADVWARVTGRLVPVSSDQPGAFAPGTNASGST